MSEAKTVPLCVFLMLLLFVLPGCIDIIEVRSETFIVGLGVEQGRKEGALRVSLLEIDLSPQAENEAGGGGSGPKGIRVLSAEGNSVSYCLKELRLKLQKRLTLSKVTFLVFGESLAEKTLLREMNYFMRSHELNSQAQLFVTSEKVPDLFENERGKLVELTTKGFSYLPGFVPAYLWKVYSQLKTNLESAMINRVLLEKDGVSFQGESFLHEGKLAYTVPKEESRFINILLNQRIDELFVFLDEKLRDSFIIKKVRKRVRYEPDAVHLTYSLKVTMSENYTGLGIDKEEDKKQLEEQLAARVKHQLNDVMKQSREKGVDILGIGEKFRQRGWNTENWEKRLKELDIVIDVNTDIISGGGLFE